MIVQIANTIWLMGWLSANLHADLESHEIQMHSITSFMIMIGPVYLFVFNWTCFPTIFFSSSLSTLSSNGKSWFMRNLNSKIFPCARPQSKMGKFMSCALHGDCDVWCGRRELAFGWSKIAPSTRTDHKQQKVMLIKGIKWIKIHKVLRSLFSQGAR